MNIIADKITFGGNSLGKNDGKNVFIPFAVPGEKLEVEITEQHKDYDIAKIIKVLDASPKRIQPPCPYYEKCGGCNMMHIEPEFQKQLRSEILAELFAQKGIDLLKNGNINVISGPDYAYRARFQLTNGGLSQKHSNEIIPIEKCLCAEKNINDYLQENPFYIRSKAKGRVHLFGSSFMTKPSDVDIVVSEENEKRSTSPKIQGGKNSKKYKFKENKHFAGTLYSPQYSITVNLNEKALSFDVRGFFQSNLFVFSKVLKLIQSLLPGGKNILDMYAGCGSISAFLADKYENVVLVEHNRDALVYAEQNLAGKGHISYGMSGAAWVKNCSASNPQFDACLIDPPRSGMEKEVCDWLCKSNIPLILSLSCEPSTHARDCQSLVKAGYKITKSFLLDFYPNTSHIESLCVLEK